TTHHTRVAYPASASNGAIRSAGAQDYPTEGAAAKLGQLEPKVLFAANGYFWNGTAFDRRDQVTDFVARVPSLKAVVGIDNLGAGDRKSTRLNSSHVSISYAVFCLKKKKPLHT